jgi:hypothetical protein
MQLFEIALSKIGLYKDRLPDFLIYLDNSIQGFDFDSEKNIIIHSTQTNKNLKVIAIENDFFIYKITGFETLKIFSSPHWCINRNPNQYAQYVSSLDDFYVVLQRYPRSPFNYKSGVTFTRKTGVVKHSFNYADRSNVDEVEKFLIYFQPASKLERFVSLFVSLFKKKNKEFEIDDDNFEMAPVDGVPGPAVEAIAMILPRF